MRINVSKRHIQYRGKSDITIDKAVNVTGVTTLTGDLVVTGTVTQTVPFTVIADPGDTNTIAPPATSNFSCAVTTAGSETRVLGTPAYLGQIGIIDHVVDGGVFTMTNADGWQGGTTSDDVATFTEVEDNMVVIAVGTTDGTDWRHIADKGVVLA